MCYTLAYGGVLRLLFCRPLSTGSRLLIKNLHGDLVLTQCGRRGKVDRIVATAGASTATYEYKIRPRTSYTMFAMQMLRHWYFLSRLEFSVLSSSAS